MLTYGEGFQLIDSDKYDNLVGKDLWVACDLYEDAACPEGACDYVYMRFRKTMQDYIEYNVLYSPEYWFSGNGISFETLYRIFRFPERVNYNQIVVCEPLDCLTTEELLEVIATLDVAEAVMKNIAEVNQATGWDL
jgi:hypothetical protein